MSRRTKKPDKDVRHILEALQAEYGAKHPRATIDAYRYNPAAIRVRITDPDFAGQDRIEREDHIESILEQLPEELRADISWLILVTPEERKQSPASLLFDDPTPSRL